MNIIDCHLHLDDKKYLKIEDAVNSLQVQLLENKIDNAMVIHLQSHKWSVQSFLENINSKKNLHSIINLNPTNHNSIELLQSLNKEYHLKGIKLHPRLQNYDISLNCVADLINYCAELNLPVIIDAFPDGDFVLNGLTPLKFAMVAKKCPNTKIVWAHMGGYKVLEFLMLAKRLQNVYFDFSYSLLYFKNSPTFHNIIYAFKNMKYEKIMYGSDFPDRDIKTSLCNTMQLLEENVNDNSKIEKLMYKNAKDFYKL